MTLLHLLSISLVMFGEVIQDQCTAEGPTHARAPTPSLNTGRPVLQEAVSDMDSYFLYVIKFKIKKTVNMSNI